MKIQELQNVMVSIATRKNKANDLLNAGFSRVFRTREQQGALTSLYEKTAKNQTPNLDVHRLGRTDSAGQAQVDGGYLMFKEQGQQIVSPRLLVPDMERVRFNLAVAEVFQKEGDDNVRLRLTWSRGGTEITLGHQKAAVVLRYMNKTYWKLFGFFNPKTVSLEGDANPIQGSIVTLNFSGIMPNPPPAQHVDQIRYLRMVDADGHIRCERQNGNGKRDFSRTYQPPTSTKDMGLDFTTAASPAA